jgi:hypothetical protein
VSTLVGLDNYRQILEDANLVGGLGFDFSLGIVEHHERNRLPLDA